MLCFTVNQCLQNRFFFEHSFNKDKSVGLQEILCTKKFLKFALDVELAQLKFTYSRVRNRRRAGNKRRAWKIWQKE